MTKELKFEMKNVNYFYHALTYERLKEIMLSLLGEVPVANIALLWQIGFLLKFKSEFYQIYSILVICEKINKELHAKSIICVEM